MVTPPPLILSVRSYRWTRVITSPSWVSCPPPDVQVSGFLQYKQRSGQPAVNRAKRVPGPSTPIETSQECTKPETPEERPAQVADGIALVGSGSGALIRLSRGRCD